MARAALATGFTVVLALSSVTPARAADASTSPSDSPTSARIRYWTGRTLLVGGVAIGGLGASLLAIAPFAEGAPFVGVGVGALAIGAVATGIGLPLWLSSRTAVEVHPNPLARGLAITGRF